MDWTSAASLPGGGDGGPVTVLDKDMQNAVIMSPASQFMAASQFSSTVMDKKSHYLSFGLLGKAVEVNGMRTRLNVPVACRHSCLL